MKKHFVVLGGGTAGWMCANLLHHHFAAQGATVTLVEAPDIGIIGVGEGSTPQLRMFFHTLGIPESQWMPRCNATFKNGISFSQWSGAKGFERYFHPFPSMPDRQTAAGFLINAHLKRQGHPVNAHPDAFFLSAYLAKQHLSPKTTSNFPISINYGYHFDSGLLGEFLKEIAIQKGIRHIKARIDQVVNNQQGEIAHLISSHGQLINGDVFFDCSGFNSVLLQQHLNVEFKSFKDNLFNDAAVAIASDVLDHLPSQTLSVARKCGWSWHIPLTHRMGNGYVYSSDYICADQAEIELRSALGLLDSEVEARHLRMKVGQVAKHWHKNCVAVGLSQGFIEPLEATALHLVQETIESFISAYTAGNFSDQHQDQFNQRISARFEGIRDYIVCHFKVNSRQDSPYWLDNQHNTNLSDSLTYILQCWDGGADLTEEISRQNIEAYYPAVSWHCLLAGYGRFPNTRPTGPASHDVSVSEISHFIQQCAKGFVPHKKAVQF